MGEIIVSGSQKVGFELKVAKKKIKLPKDEKSVIMIVRYHILKIIAMK